MAAHFSIGILAHFSISIYTYGQSDGHIGIPYRTYTGQNGLPAGMTGHMSSPRIRRR